MLNFLTVLWIIFVVFSLSFLPGFLIYTILFPRKQFLILEIYILSFGITYFIFFGYMFFVYLMGFDFYFGVIFFVLLVLIFALYFIFKNNNFNFDIFYNKEIFIFLIFFTFIISLQAITPVYAGGGWYGDWWEHYFRAEFFLQRLDLNTKIFNLYNIFARTPLYNLTQAFYLTLFGKSFVVYQITSSILSSIFIFPLILILKNIFKSNNLKILLLLLLFNSYFIQMATFTFTKSLTAFYVLSAIYFYLRFKEIYVNKKMITKTYFLLYIFFISCGYLTHQSTLFYFFALVFDLMINRLFLLIIINLVLFFFFTFGWNLWSVANIGIIGTILATPTFSYEQNFNFFFWIKQRLLNLLGAFFPALFYYQYKYYNYLPFRKIALYDCLLNYFFGSLTVIFNELGLVLLVKYFFEKIKFSYKRYYFSPLFFCIFFGFIFDIFAANNSGVPLGVAQNGMLPLGLILFAFFVSQFTKMPVFLQNSLITIFVVEFIFAHWIFTYILLANKYLKITLLYYQSNYLLKLDNNLIFIKDFLGNFYILFLLTAIILQLTSIYIFVFKKEKI